MKHLNVLIVVATLILSSCIKDPGTNYDELDPSFSFKTRNDISFTVTATDEEGKKSPGVLFSVFTANPYDEDGNLIATIRPIYQGYTRLNGSVSVKTAIPSNTTNLYIIPNYAGYQKITLTSSEVNNASIGIACLLHPTATVTPSGAIAPQTSGIERDRISLGVNYHFYTYFTAPGDYESDWGVFNSESELISYEVISNELKDLCNTWFPEKSFYSDIKETDLKILEDNTEVFLTYLGDGGFTLGGNANTLNSLLYYTYQDAADLPSGYDLKGDIPLTYAIINGRPDMTPCGTKVQLLYWNGTKYVSEFPAGTHIGFAFLRNGYLQSGNNCFNGPRGFSLNRSYIHYSTAKLNSSSERVPFCITHWSEKFKCFILGAENQMAADADFNDMLAKITTSKAAATTNTNPTPGVEVPADTYSGTLAFEDLWPYVGDYDFNDFVTDYKYELTKDGSNITSIKLTITPKALGATQHNGFGIQLPIMAANVGTISGGLLEDGNVLATIIVYSDCREAFGNALGNINTWTNLPAIASTPKVITITLASPVLEETVSFAGFNPFIFQTDMRGKEIHLVDYSPTLLADMSLFGTGYDRSNPSSGIYYRYNNTYPWAIDIANSGDFTWRYPAETKDISSAYLKYKEWTEDRQHTLSWFDPAIEGNVNTENLY